MGDAYVRLYLNLMASYLSFIEKAVEKGRDLTPIMENREFTTLYKTIAQRFRYLRDNGILLDQLSVKLHNLELAGEYASDSEIAEACVVVLLMDSFITYTNCDDGNHISLYDYLRLDDHHAVCRTALNTNVEETGIWLNPCLQVQQVFERDYQTGEEYLIRGYVRGCFRNLNNSLVHVSYYYWREGLRRFRISNIIYPPKTMHGQNSINFGFLSLSKSKDNLDLEHRDGKLYMKGLLHRDEIDNDYCESFREAARMGAHVVFGAEMLGDKEFFTGVKHGTRNLAAEILKNNLKYGLPAPPLIISPSVWENCTNRVYLFDGNGKRLGFQSKFTPYYDQHSNEREALNMVAEPEIVMIHIPGWHRIVIAICSDFLYSEDDWPIKIACRQLKTTVLLVPSYCAGSVDFEVKAKAAEQYGTTVIWGNCCGAEYKASSHAGVLNMFGTSGKPFLCPVKEKDSSENCSSCLFLCEIPFVAEFDNIYGVTNFKLNHYYH